MAEENVQLKDPNQKTGRQIIEETKHRLHLQKIAETNKATEHHKKRLATTTSEPPLHTSPPYSEPKRDDGVISQSVVDAKNTVAATHHNAAVIAEARHRVADIIAENTLRKAIVAEQIAGMQKAVPTRQQAFEQPDQELDQELARDAKNFSDAQQQINTFRATEPVWSRLANRYMQWRQGAKPFGYKLEMFRDNLQYAAGQVIEKFKIKRQGPPKAA